MIHAARYERRGGVETRQGVNVQVVLAAELAEIHAAHEGGDTEGEEGGGTGEGGHGSLL